VNQAKQEALLSALSGEHPGTRVSLSSNAYHGRDHDQARQDGDIGARPMRLVV